MKPVILYSGGLDSFVLATDMIANPFRYNVDEVPALIHFTGENKVYKHVTGLVKKHQLPFLNTLAKKWYLNAEVELEVINCDDFTFMKSSEEPQPLTVEWSHDSYKQGVNPGQHLIFLSIAFAYASSLESDRVYAAFQLTAERWKKFDEEDPDETSDDNPDFIEAVNNMSLVGGILPSQMLYTPFIDARMSKSDIIQLGLSLGVPMKYSHSCTWDVKPCGACMSCITFNRATAKIGVNVHA